VLITSIIFSDDQSHHISVDWKGLENYVAEQGHISKGFQLFGRLLKDNIFLQCEFCCKLSHATKITSSANI